MIINALQIIIIGLELDYAICGIIPDIGPFRMLA